MKVIQIANGYFDKPLYKNLFSALKQCGVISKIFVPLQIDNSVGFDSLDDIIVAKCFNRIDRYIYYTKQYKTIKALKRLVDIEEYNLIHAHTLFSTGYTAWKIKKEINIPYIVAVRNTDVNLFFKKMPWLRNIGIQIMLEAQYIIFLSKPYADFIMSQYIPKNIKNKIEDKIKIIPNGIDDYFITNSGGAKNLSSDGLKIIQIGDIDTNKNVEMTIRVVNKLRERYNTSLTIVGDIKEANLKTIISRNCNFVTYLSKKPKEDIAKLLRESDILCMPSHNETFGLVYAEAMSQGVPVIYTRGQGFDGQFPNGTVGYAVDDNNESDIEEAIEKIVTNYSIISSNCIANFQKYCWKNIAMDYVELYNKLN